MREFESKYQRIENCFREVFDDDRISINDQTSPKDIKGWNSLAQLTLFTTVERPIGVTFGVVDLVKIKFIDDVIRIINEKIV